MDFETASYAIREARAYSDSQRLAYVSESTGSITWDGDTTGKDIIPQSALGGSYKYVRVREPVKVASVKSIKLGIQMHYPQNDLELIDDLVNSLILLHGEPVVIVYHEDADGFRSGTYLATNGVDYYVSEVESVTQTTVHPIDQKFIPPLDALYLNGTDGKQYKVSVDDTGALAVTAV